MKVAVIYSTDEMTIIKMSAMSIGIIGVYNPWVYCDTSRQPGAQQAGPEERSGPAAVVERAMGLINESQRAVPIDRILFPLHTSHA